MKSKSAVSKTSHPPRPKLAGVVRRTPEWASAIKQIEAGKSIEIRLTSLGEVRNPINAFLAALKRKYRKTYQIYARNGVVYAIPKRTV